METTRKKTDQSPRGRDSMNTKKQDGNSDERTLTTSIYLLPQPWSRYVNKYLDKAKLN